MRPCRGVIALSFVSRKIENLVAGFYFECAIRSDPWQPSSSFLTSFLLWSPLKDWVSEGERGRSIVVPFLRGFLCSPRAVGVFASPRFFYPSLEARVSACFCSVPEFIHFWPRRVEPPWVWCARSHFSLWEGLKRTFTYNTQHNTGLGGRAVPTRPKHPWNTRFQQSRAMPNREKERRRKKGDKNLHSRPNSQSAHEKDLRSTSLSFLRKSGGKNEGGFGNETTKNPTKTDRLLLSEERVEQYFIAMED